MRSSYTDVGRMRGAWDKSFREELIRHEGDSSFRGVENTSKEEDLAAFKGTSFTVRARERAAFEEDGKSLGLLLEASDRTVAELVVAGVDEGR